MTVQPGCVVRIHGRAEAPASDTPGSDALDAVASVEEIDLRSRLRRWSHARQASAPCAVPLRQLKGPLRQEARP